MVQQRRQFFQLLTVLLRRLRVGAHAGTDEAVQRLAGLAGRLDSVEALAHFVLPASLSAPGFCVVAPSTAAAPAFTFADPPSTSPMCISGSGFGLLPLR